MQEIITNLQAHHPDTPIILFTKGSGAWLELLNTSPAQVIGLDWQTSLTRARRILGDTHALQGNLDPAILRADEQTIKTEVDKVLQAYGEGPGHIFNLGHGITPDIHPDKVAFLVHCVKTRKTHP